MPSRIFLTFKAFRELGMQSMGLYALYRLGLITGYWKKLTPEQTLYPEIFSPEKQKKSDFSFARAFPIQPPSQSNLKQWLGKQEGALLQEAEEICQGKSRFFGELLLPLIFSPVPVEQMQHWTEYERGKIKLETEDIKFVWEPGRFTWVFPLIRAYILSGDEKYPTIFWQYTEAFLAANPPNMGPHWMSSQEVALRLLAFLFAGALFEDCPCTTEQRHFMLVNAIIAHARRIPATLCYARSQNNNHLLSEALGLYAAGTLVKNWLSLSQASVPNIQNQAGKWKKDGLDWLLKGLEKQIAIHGAYTQHSTNYHRLMLQVVLTAQLFMFTEQKKWPEKIQERLSAATYWLQALFDPTSGQVCNLGHNDGSYILPLSSGNYADYRPVIQAASRAFLGKQALGEGPWDEMSHWFRVSDPLSIGQAVEKECPNYDESLEEILPPPRLNSSNLWATIRTVHFNERPAHADLLHVDIWWKGQNVAMDAGTFSYNAPTPWDNQLANTFTHNTISVDGKNQMQRAGRFLWLERTDARLIGGEKSNHSLIAEHMGYRKLSLLHRRFLIKNTPHQLQVLDLLLPTEIYPQIREARIHWLLPDWPHTLIENCIRLQNTQGSFDLTITPIPDLNTPGPEVIDIQLIRAGKVICGEDGEYPNLGWYSPTYGLKIPALSIQMTLVGILPFSLRSDWIFSE